MTRYTLQCSLTHDVVLVFLQKPVILSPNPFKVKIKSGSIIEKLQVSEAGRGFAHQVM